MTTFEQGWTARPFKQQFPQLDTLAADTLDRLNMAIVELYMREMLTDAEVLKIRTKRFPRVVAEVLSTQSERRRTGGKLTRYPPSERQAGWWYCSPDASTIGPFDTAEEMETDIRKYYIEPELDKPV